VKFLSSILVVLTLWAGVATAPSFADSPSGLDMRPATVGGWYVGILSSDALSDRGYAPDPTVDSARAEFEAGRYWHASQILRELGSEGAVLSPPDLFLLALADAGWKNWDDVLAGLEGADWLDGIGGGEGRLLLARALEEAGRWDEAAQQYGVFRSTGAITTEAPWAASREAQVAARADLWVPMLGALEVAGRHSPELAKWTVFQLARNSLEEGNGEQTLRVLPLIRGDSVIADMAWDLEPRALLVVGDTARALERYEELVSGDLSAAQRGEALEAIGALAEGKGDVAEAHAAYQASLEASSRGASGSRAAWGVLRTGTVDAEQALRSARVLDRVRENHQALQAYERYLAALLATGQPEPAVLLARARLLSAVGRHEAAVVEFRKLVETDDPDFELRVLGEWQRARNRQGRRDAVRTIQGWIIERYPESREAVDLVVSRANAALSRGSYAEAAAGFERAIATGTSHSSAGLARMRLGQIHLQQNDEQAAAEVFRSYLEEFPNGQRWAEASYWAARSLGALGRDEDAQEYLGEIRNRDVMSYYGVLAFDLLQEPFRPDVPAGPAPAPRPWLRDDLKTLDLLVAAGLDAGVEAHIAGLIARAEGSVPESLDLADALIERGFSIAGIRLGQGLLADGAPQSKRLLRVLYPFPYRELVTREASERNIDPLFLAALIRQESAFTPAIYSPAGAIGLMQVMPATGRDLARSQGLRGFTSESLETAEINLHLGTRFWLDMELRYSDGKLPLVLSAYNAGPTRARRWRQLPEFEDLLRFTERIPFDETRGYVKNITRNVGLYQFLYGDD
jgi:soluble lytic murein transglycosylase